MVSCVGRSSLRRLSRRGGPDRLLEAPEVVSLVARSTMETLRKLLLAGAMLGAGAGVGTALFALVTPGEERKQAMLKVGAVGEAEVGWARELQLRALSLGRLVPAPASLQLPPHSCSRSCPADLAGSRQRLGTALPLLEFKRGAGNVTRAYALLIGRGDLKSKPARRAALWERSALQPPLNSHPAPGRSLIGRDGGRKTRGMPGKP